MKMKLGKHATAGLLCAMIAALVLVLPGSALTADTDTDFDGFSDSLEATGITTVTNSFFPKCDGQTVRSGCVDPNTGDLFVIIVPGLATPSLLPEGPLDYLAGGTGFGTHRIDGTSQTSRTFTTSSTQKALKITEDNTSVLDSGNTFGVSTFGTPNDYDFATIYSLRIKTFYEKTSGLATKVCFGNTCYDKTTNPTGFNDFVKQLWQTYQLKNTIAHESGHMMMLTATADRKIGNHYPTGTGVLMDQFVYYTNKSGTVTWYIPDHYALADKPVLKR